MEENKIIQDFAELQESKKKNVILTRLILLFAILVVLGSFVFAFSVTKAAYNRILVVDRQSGEYFNTTAEDAQQLFVARVKTTCNKIAYYANSFDRLTVKQNQAKAALICHKPDLQIVFSLYNQEKSYHEALERGVIYSCELEEVNHIGNTKPYDVAFTSILTITDGMRQTKFRIFSEGKLIPATAQYPENETGLYFISYTQTIQDF